MKNFGKWIMFCLLVLAGTGIADGQYVIKALPRWMVSSQGIILVPGSPTKTFIEREKWGYQVEAMYRVQYNKPFLAGLYFNEAGLSRYVLEYDNGDQQIREKANTRRLEGGIVVGVYPEINWLLQPYVLGRFGGALFQSSSILTDQDTKESIDRISESAKSVPSYGLDIGVHIVPNIWYIRGDVRVGIVRNPSVRYLILNEDKKGTVQYPIEAFDEHTSAGKWLKVSAGVSFLF
ncbi:MAG TPA: hypothetical protein VJ508_17990 [Saprospiraceae bacterium]|nr:hypothetical protein [Saprospiraceae bacterium]